MELAALAAQLAPLELRVHTIASDGDCLYHAVADQCTRLRLPLTVLPTNRTLRALAAKEMRAHQDAYAGFVDDGAVAFDEYVAQRVERAGAWGGQLELRALAKALHADITVHQAHRAPLRVPCADDDDNATATAASAAVPQLHVSYHAKQYALGAHYNSLRVVDLSDDR